MIPPPPRPTLFPYHDALPIFELAGGGAVAAAHLVGVDLELRAHVDFRFRTCEQSAQRLARVGAARLGRHDDLARSEEHTSELQSPDQLVCRLLLEKKKKNTHK